MSKEIRSEHVANLSLVDSSATKGKEELQDWFKVLGPSSVSRVKPANKVTFRQSGLEWSFVALLISGAVACLAALSVSLISAFI